jgi:hypothetical protein
LKLLVYEHVSGGGFAGQPLDPSVLSEGFGMLRCLTQDFKAANYEVTVLLDERLSKFNPPITADFIVPIFYAHEAEKILAASAKSNDAVFIIAPETGQKLQSLVRLVGKLSKLSLSCEVNGIQKVSNKAVLYETLKNKGFCTPETLALDVGGDSAEIEREIKSKLGYPAVLKPSDGVSCGGLSVTQDGNHIETAIAKIKAVSSCKSFIVQKFICGEAASVSLICTGTEIRAISLNKQNVQLSQPSAASSYEGGAVPFAHPLKTEAFKTAEEVAASFSGLRGYVGVDLVLTEDKPFVVDVNPRLTTSYVGMSKVAGFNVAEAMIDAVLKNQLPTQRENKGFVRFGKVMVSKPSFDAFQKATQLDGVISPPFPLEGYSEAVSLVAGLGESVFDAQLRFEEAKKRLLNIISGGK